MSDQYLLSRVMVHSELMRAEVDKLIDQERLYSDLSSTGIERAEYMRSLLQQVTSEGGWIDAARRIRDETGVDLLLVCDVCNEPQELAFRVALDTAGGAYVICRICLQGAYRVLSEEGKDNAKQSD